MLDTVTHQLENGQVTGYIWTIYNKHHPDCPNQHARCFKFTSVIPEALPGSLYGTYEELQAIFLNAGLCRLMRSPEDDPSIVESWI